MSAKAVLTLVIILLSVLMGLYAQETEYEDVEVANSTGDVAPIGQRIPLIFIVLLVLIFALIFHFHILNKRFVDLLEQQYPPQSAAASSMLIWWLWVGLGAFIMIGLDPINMDYYNVVDHFRAIWPRLLVIGLIIGLGYLVFSPYKKKR